MSADKRRIGSHAEKKAQFRAMNLRQTNEVKSRVRGDPSILDWISIGVKNKAIALRWSPAPHETNWYLCE
jgi:hypothetical protein